MNSIKNEKNTASLTINASQLSSLDGCNAAGIGFDIKRLAEDGVSDINVQINDDATCPDSSENDIYENNGIKFSKYLDYVNNTRLAHSYFPYDNIDDMNKHDQDAIMENQLISSLGDGGASSIRYNESSNEVHIPVESTYIMDDNDCAALSVDMLRHAVNEGNGEVSLVLDGYEDKGTYHKCADEAIQRYQDSANRILKSQKVAPNYRSGIAKFV